jgi:hypothetical protein
VNEIYVYLTPTLNEALLYPTLAILGVLFLMVACACLQGTRH